MCDARAGEHSCRLITVQWIVFYGDGEIFALNCATQMDSFYFDDKGDKNNVYFTHRTDIPYYPRKHAVSLIAFAI
jgi:hypothetical protein